MIFLKKNSLSKWRDRVHLRSWRF